MDLKMFNNVDIDRVLDALHSGVFFRESLVHVA
jgi:hypothetical protein